LYKNARNTYEEVIELVNDSIDCLGLIDKEQYVNRAMTFFFQHVFMPQSYAMYVDLLSGNVPICFTELRLIAESLAKCIYADSKYLSDMFFGEKLVKLENDLTDGKVTSGRVIKEAEKILGLNDRVLIGSWKRLSNEWVHPTGIARRVIDYVSKRKNAPPWGLILPMCYTKEDLPELEVLQREVVSFREIMDAILERK
jgi:hypothetical protein